MKCKLIFTQILLQSILSCTILCLPIKSIGQNTDINRTIVPSKDYGFIKCTESEVPLFNLPVDSILVLEIKTDFQKLYQTTKPEQSRIDGTISYLLSNQKVELPIKIKARGKSRFEYCTYKPLDVKFSSTLDSTIFEGIGNKVFITTQCGDNGTGEWIFQGSELEHKNRLLAEYYIYSMLETFGTVSNSVSLCKIKYVNQDGSTLANHLAFIIETYEDAANRCGLGKNKEPIQLLDESSLMNAKLINQFFTNYDWMYQFSDSLGWHGNNIKLLNSNDSIGYILPYDFDLNSIMFPEYWKNESDSFDKHCYLFQELLTEQFSGKKKLEAPFTIYEHIPEIREIIENSFMAQDIKEKFRYWLNSYEFILFNHLTQYKKYKKLVL